MHQKILTCLAMFTAFTACGETLQLRVGPGPEDIVRTTLPGSRQEVLITSLARRKPGRKDLAVRGFMHIGLKDGRPVVLNAQPDIPEVQKYTGAWQGLSWQPECAIASGHGMLAATRARSFIHGKWTDSGGGVDLFVWHCPPGGVPHLRLHSSSAVLKATKMDFSFNAVALAKDGTLYASVMSFTTGRPEPVTRSRLEPWQENQKITTGAVFVLLPGAKQWALAAEQIPGANGLHLSADEKTLFVNSAGSSSVLGFARDPHTKTFKYTGHRFTLPSGAAPDNLRMDAQGRLHTTGTPCKLVTAIYLASNALFGTSFGLGPRGITWTWEHPLNQADTAVTHRWPRSYHGPSTALPLGDWWFVSQMVDDRLLCVREPATH